MSSRRRLAAIAVAGMVAVTGCYARTAPMGGYGRPVIVQMPTHRLEGELLAVAPDTLWLLSGARVTPVSTTLARQMYVQRHDYGMGRTVRDMAWSGLGTGLALMLSCMMYEGSDDGDGNGGGCALIVPGSALLFAATGVVFGAINSMTTHRLYGTAEVEPLRPFARYPQGLPDSVRALPRAP